MCFNIILPSLLRSPEPTHSPSLPKPCPLPHVTHSLHPPPSFMIWAPEFYLVWSKNHEPLLIRFSNFPPSPCHLDPNIFSALHSQKHPAFVLLLMWETKFHTQAEQKKRVSTGLWDVLLPFICQVCYNRRPQISDRTATEWSSLHFTREKSISNLHL